MKPTQSFYAALQQAYDIYNKELFNSTLCNCLLTLKEKHNAYGFFRFKYLKDSDEIALNPDYFAKREAIETLSTLVHEMCHLWQHHKGSPKKSNPHDAEWGTKMTEIGLKPTGAGLHSSHTIMPGEMFEKITNDLVFNQTDIKTELENFQAFEKPKSKSGRYTKYKCPLCSVTVNGRKGLKVVCGEHNELMLVVNKT